MTVAQRSARLSGVLILLTLAYGLAMWQPVRDVYSPADKLAHAAVFFVVVGALAWAMQGWSVWKLGLLAAALGGAVELQQWFVPRFTASWQDWLADLVGIGVAMVVIGAWRQIKTTSMAAAESESAEPGLLPDAQFRSAIEALPLVSIDWVLSNPAGEFLLGQRLNAPARGAWFTPGSRVRKGEALRSAKLRIAMTELGVSRAVAEAWADRAEAMGAWDHMYPDSALDPALPTHYVNLPYWLALTDNDLAALRLPVGEQHRGWAWVSVSRKVPGFELHPYVQPYATWVTRRLGFETAEKERARV